MVFLDTHIVVWLYIKDLNKFSSESLNLLEEEALYISPMVQLELDYLKEIGRIKVGGEKILSYLGDRIGLNMDGMSFVPLAERSGRLQWTRDPFDRIITAQADFRKALLLTKDRLILKNYPRAVAP